MESYLTMPASTGQMPIPCYVNWLRLHGNVAAATTEKPHPIPGWGFFICYSKF